MNLKEQLLGCKTYAEAKPILETAGISISGHELARTAFNIQAKQPTIAQHFLQTIVQETDGGSSHQSSSTTGLVTQGSEAEVGNVKEQSDAKDQMGVPIGEMMPMGQQQYPPMQPQQSCGQQPPRPQMTPQQQIQYMVREAIKTEVAPYINRLQESVKTLDKKIMETSRPQVHELDLSDKLGGKPTLARKMFVQETVGEVDLQIARSQISRINDAMNKGIY